MSWKVVCENSGLAEKPRVQLICAANLSIKFCVQKVVVSIQFTERMLGKESFGCWSFAWNTASWC